MSFWARVELEVFDIDALKMALRVIDDAIDIVPDSVARGHSNRRFPWVIRLRGQYDVGLDQPLGFGTSFASYYDSWGGHVERELGEDLCRLKQQYALEMVRRRAADLGYAVMISDPDEEGTIAVELCVGE